MLIKGEIKCGNCGVKLRKRFWKHAMSFVMLCRKCYNEMTVTNFHIEEITEHFPVEKAVEIAKQFTTNKGWNDER